MSADKKRKEEDSLDSDEDDDDEMAEISVSTPSKLKLTSYPFKNILAFGDTKNHRDISVPFASSAAAEIAHGSLSVDKEPKRGGVVRTMSLKDSTMFIHFEASEARLLRVSMNSFLDHLILVQKTIDQFGPPLS